MTKSPIVIREFYFAFAFLLLTSLAVRAQIIITNFTGVSLTDARALGTGSTPPDTMGCPGTNQFVEFINGAFAVYNKAGVRQLLMTDSNFWVSAGITPSAMNAGIFDPRLQYDAGSGRWFATELTGENTGNHILLARSDSANPSGTWKAVSFLASTNQFGDFDTLGVDSQAVYVSVNVFADGTSGGFTGVSLFSIPKANLLASTPSLANIARFENLSGNTYGFSLQGVNNPDAGPGHGVIIAIDNQFYNRFDRATVNNPSTAGATLSAPIYVPSAYDGTPNPTAQPGGNTVDGGDDRFSGAVRQIGGYIFMANSILNTNNNRNAVHWIVLNEANNIVTSEGIVTDPNYDFTYPSIAASHSGKVLMAFNRTGATAPAGDISIYAVSGTMVNGVVTMGTPFLLQQGNISNYAGIGVDPLPYRWGDYSTTMFDPTDENLVWTIQEIPTSSTTWGTEVSLISLATNRPALNFKLVGNQATISWPLSTDPGYVLQSSTIMNSSAWTTVTGVAANVIINQRVVTMTVTGPALYFRLKK